MLYLLLIVIAIGVLLLSEEGKAFLNLAGILALVAGGLYLGFWIVMLAIGFIYSNTGQSFITGAVPFAVGSLILWAIYYFGNKLNDKEKRARIWRKIRQGMWVSRQIMIVPMAFILLFVGYMFLSSMILPFIAGAVLIYISYKKYKQRDFTKEKIRGYCLEIWRKHKTMTFAIAFVILSFSFFVFIWVFSVFLPS